MEIWKEITNYEGLYEISNMGNVRSMDKWHNNRFFPSKIMCQFVNQRGYLRVSTNHPIYKKKSLEVHLLVGNHFVPNPNNYPVINHLKGNKKDNRHFMLEWTTHSKNTQHAYDTGLKKKGSAHCMARRVLDKQTGAIFGTIGEAARFYNINQNTLSYYLSGKRTNKTALIFE